MTAVNAGSAVGYLDLNIEGFLSGLRKAQDAAAENMQKVEKTFSNKLNGIANSCNAWGKTLSLSITTPLVAIGGTLLKFGMDFESAMANVKAITQMTDEELKTLKDGIFEVSRATGISSIELARQVKMVAEAGGDLNLVMEQLTHGANLAIATETDLATTLDMVGSTMKTFGLEVEDTQRVVDSLASVTTMANTTLSDLNSAYVNVGGIAAQVGVSIDEVNAILVELANAGLKGGAAGTSLAGVFRNLSAPTEKAKGELENLGVALYDDNKASRNMIDIMKELEEVFSEMTDEQRAYSESVIFDTVSRKAWLTMTGSTIVLSNEMIDTLEYLGIAINNSNGDAREMAEIMEELEDIFPSLSEEQRLFAENVFFGEEALEAWATKTEGGIEAIVALAKELSNASDEYDGLGQAAGMMNEITDTTAMCFTKLWNEVHNLGVEFVATTGPALKEFLGLLAEWLKWVVELGPEWHSFIITVVGFAAVIGPVLIGLATMIKTLTAIAGVLPGLTILVKGLWVAITGPIGLAVIAITGLGLAIWYFWDDIKEVCQGITILWGEFTTWFMDKLGAFGSWITDTWSSIWTNVKNFYEETWQGIKIWFEEYIAWYKDTLTEWTICECIGCRTTECRWEYIQLLQPRTHYRSNRSPRIGTSKPQPGIRVLVVGFYTMIENVILLTGGWTLEIDRTKTENYVWSMALTEQRTLLPTFGGRNCGLAQIFSPSAILAM